MIREVFKIKLPLVGSFLARDELESEEIFDLTLEFDSNSKRLSIKERVSPEKLFKNYFYKTGVSNVLKSFFKGTAQKIGLDKNNILEIGCNDFSFLRNFDGNNNIVGVDPSDVAKNAFEEERFKTIEFYNEFFGENFADKLNRKFDIIYSANNFAHINDIEGYARAAKNCLTENGDLIIQVHYGPSIVKNNHFSFIYHEHVYYWSVYSLSYFLKKIGFHAYDVSFNDIHGSSFELKASISKKPKTEFYLKALQQEKEGKFNTFSFYSKYFKRLQKDKKSFENLIKANKKKGHIICGYGASGQAVTFLSIFDIGKDDLDFIIDDSPLKQGKYMPQSHIPIVSSDCLSKADCVVVLSHTFFKEIYEKHKNKHKKWIIPLPYLQIIN